MGKEIACSLFILLFSSLFLPAFLPTLTTAASISNTGQVLNLALSGLVISNAKVEVKCDFRKSTTSKDVWLVSVTFDFQVWKPDSFSGHWNPRIIVHVGTEIPESPLYEFPRIIGPPLPWVEDEDWDQSYPGLYGSRTVTGHFKRELPLLPGRSVHMPLLFGLEPSYYSTSKVLQRLKDGEIELHQTQQVEIRNRLSVRPTSLDFGKVYGTEVLMMPIVFSEENLGSIVWDVSSDVSWISVEPSAGNMTTGRIVIVVEANSSGLSRGQSFGVILIRSDVGTVSIPVNLLVVLANSDGSRSAIRVINFGTSGTRGVSGMISDLLGYGVQLDLHSDFQIAAGVSLPSYLLVDCPFTKIPSSPDEYVTQISMTAYGSEGGRAWVNIDGGIQGSATTTAGSFDFNYRFSHVDLYNLLTNTNEGWEIDFNRLAEFRVPLNGRIATRCTVGPIPLYSLDVGMGKLSFSASFEFSVEVWSYTSGNVTISGPLISPNTLPLKLREGSATEREVRIKRNETTGDSYLQISSSGIEYGASNITLPIEKVSFQVRLAPTSPYLIYGPSITRSFAIQQNIGPILIGSYGPIRSAFGISRALDLTDPVANAGQDLTAPVGEAIRFNGSASYDNIGIIGYEWDFGDGNRQVFPSDWGHSPFYSYRIPGTYTVTLTVRDEIGNFANDFITVIILDPNPVTILDVIVVVTAVGSAIGVAIIGVFLSRRRAQNTSSQRVS